MKKVLIMIAMLLIAADGFAQMVISAELRPRFEYRNGYKKMPEHGTVAATLFSQRTRLKFGWMSKRIVANISVQDVRVWGDEPMKKDVAGLGLYEGWMEIYVTDSASFKLGRQELVFDNQRLFSNNNWSQKAVTHDALRFRYHTKGWELNLFGAFNQSRDTTFSTDYASSLANYKLLSGALLSKRLGKFLITGLGAMDGYQKKNTLNTMYLRATYGLIGTFSSGAYAAGLRGFYQSGQCETGNFVNAFYASAEASAKFCKKFSVRLGAEYQSGQDSTNKTDKQVHYFTTLYGSGHTFNGYLDYFTKPADTRYTGLMDAFMALGLNSGEKINLNGDLHYFSSTNRFPDKINGGNIEPFLAWEADLTFKWSFYKDIDLQVGYSALFGSNSLETLMGGDPAHYAHWAYAMVTYKPTLLRWEPEKK